VHEGTGAWRILDYKTGAEAQDPAKAHRRKDGEWKDLQLPLYTLLARELGLGGDPELGYACLGSKEEDVRLWMATWKRDDIDSALEKAREVALAVRHGRFDEVGRDPFREPVFEALVGRALLAPEDDGADGDDGGDGG
jgi:hypothetical protein